MLRLYRRSLIDSPDVPEPSAFLDTVFGHHGRKLRKKQTLTELEQLMHSEHFVRIHRCYLLNVDRLSSLEPYAKDSRVAILTDGTRLPVSRSGCAGLPGAQATKEGVWTG
jgi:hypothetical protein